MTPICEVVSRFLDDSEQMIGELTSALTQVVEPTQVTAHLAQIGALRARRLQDQAESLAYHRAAE